MMRAYRVLVLSIAVCAAGVLAVAAQDAKKPDKQAIPGGIEAKVKQVDVEAGKLTVTLDGRDRTFTITDDTTIVGPRGGVVRRRLESASIERVRQHPPRPLPCLLHITTGTEAHCASKPHRMRRPHCSNLSARS
jgi:hypothetical protein